MPLPLYFFFRDRRGYSATSEAIVKHLSRLRTGAKILRHLHAEMRRVVHPQTTFHDFAVWNDRELATLGYENLDFRKNAGHSISRDGADRIYVESGNHVRLGEVDFFTFEPHIRATANAYSGGSMCG